MAAIEAFWLTSGGDQWGPPPPPPTNSTAPLGTFYVQAPDFRPAALRKARCRCEDGVASTGCALHCHLVRTRQRSEDELIVLALV